MDFVQGARCCASGWGISFLFHLFFGCTVLLMYCFVLCSGYVDLPRYGKGHAMEGPGGAYPGAFFYFAGALKIEVFSDTQKQDLCCPCVLSSPFQSMALFRIDLKRFSFLP